MATRNPRNQHHRVHLIQDQVIDNWLLEFHVSQIEVKLQLDAPIPNSFQSATLKLRCAVHNKVVLEASYSPEGCSGL